MAKRKSPSTSKERAPKAGPASSGQSGGDAGERQATHPAFTSPPGGDHTPDGAPTKQTAGYGTSQGASGATSGGADPGGSLNIPQP